jgi:soluble lytic murein transglycosylase-like protein
MLPVDTTGTGGLIGGDARGAIKALAADTVAGADSAVYEFKQGVAHFQLKDIDPAMEHLRRCERMATFLRPLARELIGDIEAGRGKPSVAVNAYLLAQMDSTLPLQAASVIQDKLYALVKEKPLLVVPYPELAGLAASRRIFESRGPDSAAARIDSLFARGQYARLDSVLAASLDSMDADRKCSLAARVAALSQTPDRGDTSLGTARLFSLSRAAYACKKNAIADSLLVRCEHRSDFARACDAKQYLFLKGMLSYGLSKFADAVRYLSLYVKKAGPTPDAVMTMGRANRSLANDSAADAWYQLFSTLYPKHASAQDVLWYLAWEQEEEQHYQKAATLYRRVIGARKNGPRSDEAFFRAALCLYKDGRYGLACSAFASFLQANEDSPFASGALYWKAKCLSALGDQRAADAALRKVVRQAPTDYYSFRAREMLVLTGDTARLPELDTSYDQSGTRAWLDSVSTGKRTLSTTDSMQLERGALLALCGLAERAEPFLDAFEVRYPANLALQFDLAGLYKDVNRPVLSYRVGRRLGWRVPPPARATIPRPLFDIMYPRPFFDIVSREAGRNSLDPFLVLAVMRQESVFDPSVVSRVGAIGLMQLMPSTSQTICKSLGESYSADSLYRPGINIRQGAYYIKHLLDQFGGNLVLAIASYNGGPAKAAEWFAKNKRTTFDLFIEDVGFTETRGYVKKVLANYWTYRRFAAKPTEK